MQRVFVSVVNAAACLFQKRVPSRVTGDVKKVHYRRHARTCVMCDLCQMARHARRRVRPRRAPSFVSVANGWRVVPKVNEDCAVHVRHAKEKVACRRRRFNRCVHIARSARFFFMFFSDRLSGGHRLAVVVCVRMVKWNSGVTLFSARRDYYPRLVISCPRWDYDFEDYLRPGNCGYGNGHVRMVSPFAIIEMVRSIQPKWSRLWDYWGLGSQSSNGLHSGRRPWPGLLERTRERAASHHVQQ